MNQMLMEQMTDPSTGLRMILFYIPFFLCWGSFLNVVAYRVLRGMSIVTPRSACTTCHRTIFWYDNIPVLSWLLLRGSCRFCKQPISVLYPFIELLTALTLTALYLLVPTSYFAAYALFFSALIVTIRSDLETMLISRYMTLFLIPIAISCAALGMLPISIQESFLGSVTAYLFLYTIIVAFRYLTGKDGMGYGDLELLACIGTFLGVIGWWISLMIGSITGSIVGIIYMIATKKDRTVKIPFGPFLALGAMIATVAQQQLISFFYY
jgi:leader peptidase (prepilin peptidase)/N-methyltransferase